jgi:hypothetical protein
MQPGRQSLLLTGGCQELSADECASHKANPAFGSNRCQAHIVFQEVCQGVERFIRLTSLRRPLCANERTRSRGRAERRGWRLGGSRR